MRSVGLILLALVAICHSKTIPWVKKQPAIHPKNAPETIPWVEKQPAIVPKKAPETIPWVKKQPAIRRTVEPETVPWVKKQPAIIRKVAPETIPWVKKQPAIVPKKLQETIQPAVNSNSVQESIPWLTKQPAIVMSDAENDIPCPDKVSSCPAGSTCCPLKDGFYGCCPSGEGAVCCDDQKHCCPSGFKCNPATYQCLKEDWGFEALVQFPAKKSQYVKCPGGKAKCPVGNTCCMMGKNQYGCCPTSQATCCPDTKHCCAKGYECNKKSKKCIFTGIIRLLAQGLEDDAHSHPQQSVDYIEVEPAHDGDAENAGIWCGGWSYCASNSTCCRLKRGGWGCCPLPNANCCIDESHCCPHNFVCNDTESKCDPPDQQQPNKLTGADDKIFAVAVEEIQPNLVCPDGQSQCPDGNTCCKLSSGQYGCCPLPNAVCCSDNVHCCPNGYTCGAGTCTKADDQISAVAVEEIQPNLVCPDSQSQCPDGSTCCKLSSGQYGCCPLPSAVCCSDGVHCCPNGYTCGAGTCTKADDKISATAVEKSQPNIVCPDGQSQCPDGSTCCKLSSGQWGCCPLPNAVCCSDRQHCCPNGYKCEGTVGTCSKSVDQFSMMTIKETVQNMICPDSQSECPTGSSCCQLSSGQWGCCPYVEAVCCSDRVHCCPSGYKCDLSSESCVMSNGQKYLSFGEIVDAPAPNVVCPGSQSQCPDGNTCCKLSSGQYGCCPLPNAVCCSDGLHCCPSGSTCDVSAGTCTKADDQIFAVAVEEIQPNVVCPGGQSQCPDGSTCCKLSSGQYGCCPLPNAVCCSDGEHCCPNGYTCGAGTCQKSNDVDEIFAVAVEEVQPNIVCPDGQSQCPDGNTCCKLSSGQWGCCPLPSAVCCSDGEHCCPNGYTCSAGTCTKADDQISATAVEEIQPNLVCPDGQSQCPDGNTCCKLSSGQYGCCPLPNAVCCSDGQHCCPNGYTCGAGTCQKSNDVDQIFAVTVEEIQPNVVCPDGQSQCPDGNTCCKLSSGQYGCCPLPNAVCCSDNVHCCPNGYTCGAGTCTKANEQITATAVEEIQPNIVCPDGQSQCPDGNTCCKLSSGQWGCCPLPSAVCCSDGEHCCPNGYTCSAGTCTKADDQISATAVEEIQPNLVCPDGQSQCPDGNTCCKLSSGQYGCCPLPNAVCCSDNVHCCPNGYTCGAGTCTKADDQISATAVEEIQPNIVCPDGQSQCPDGNTCCKLSSGQWGCCPLPSAVCCSDGEHCCPNGYTCSAGICTKADDQISATAVEEIQPNIVCPDGQSQCPDGNTCCKLSSGQYGCCPLPNAVCCSDNVHCCPNGYTCGAGTCTKADDQVYAVTVEEIQPNVVCPDGQSQCPDGNTCCKLSSGQWGCCPLPSAVCCSDGEHCCPNGYTCSSGSCIKSSHPILSVFVEDSIAVSDVICPGGKAQCHNDQTCCKMSSGDWGCCPFPNAECCSDQLHCCPKGYTCNQEGSSCQKRNQLDTIITSMNLREHTKVEGVICPDGQSQCPDGNTCCKTSSGSYGCCPLPNAVCCSDNVHCCPSGYTCDVSAGTCTKADDLISATAVEEIQPNLVCPDGQSQCPDGSTCCKLSSGQWGCCPLPNAVCCSDGQHCCPSGYTCGSGGFCTKADDQIFAAAVEEIQPNVVCPGGQAQCPSGSTCCKLSSGQWGCCPLPNAVCCSDGQHCCPNGYTCNGGSCTKASEKTTSLRVSDVVCPDGSSSCQDGSTCCLLASGNWGCCPYTNAVCCSDGEHCCPSGYTCDIGTGTCAQSAAFTEMMSSYGSEPVDAVTITCPDQKSRCRNGDTCCQIGDGLWACCPLPNAVCCGDRSHCCPQGYTCDIKGKYCAKTSQLVSLVTVSAQSVMCPDGQSQCPDGSTCCKLSSGQWGCCPLPNAVCCSDGQHCCPNGYTCNVDTCVKADDQISATAVEEIQPNVVCPDGQSQCPDGNTCCKTSSGSYGCCPLPNAVCCSDNVHCCPNGYTCDVSAGTCQKSKDVDEIFAVAVEEVQPNIVCPDGQSQCPDGNTCCKLSSGQWGCCPLPNAVCCSDGQHCCPNGYTCNVDTCVKADEQISATAVEEIQPNVVCPDGQSQCPDGNTCCKTSSGSYGCCPLPNAVCCSDNVHCCPNGYTCDVSAGTCQKSKDVDEIFAVAVEEVQPNIVCPDGQSQCPDGNTCCKLSSGQWGCCPLPNAVCCSDGQHCCPNGYTCNVDTCVREDDQIFAVTVEEIQPNIVCPDGQSQCPDGNTCCKLSSGQWGCCPLPNAVCCSDGQHCCPNGYTCNVDTCVKADEQISATAVEEIQPNIVCPDGQSQCPDGNTCCKLSSGQWGCCPLPNAVCCSDGQHCCPNGYTCNVDTCVKADDQISTTAIEEIQPNEVCPGGQTQCPEGNTCCKLSSGQYACCPLPNAVCCSDGLHCCPSGSTCDVSAGGCSKVGDQVALIAIKEWAGSVVCPDGQSECPDGNTCCLLASGQWGCCPLPNAVCCTDGEHCCPNGYKCDLSSGSCFMSDENVVAMATLLEDAKSNTIPCPDTKYKCNDGNTCCKLPSGSYGCCPIAHAVCCDDGLHCCPSGHVCDIKAGTCKKGQNIIPFLLKTPAMRNP